MSNTNLWIMVGIPGSGKSYFAKNILMTDDSWQYISRDEVRFSMFLKIFAIVLSMLSVVTNITM